MFEDFPKFDPSHVRCSVVKERERRRVASTVCVFFFSHSTDRQCSLFLCQVNQMFGGSCCKNVNSAMSPVLRI